MTEDVETILSGLEARLRELQGELEEPEPFDEPGRESIPEPAAASPPFQPPPPSGLDALDRFGLELRRLVSSWDAVAAELRGTGGSDGLRFHGDLFLDATVDFPGLCALGSALASIPGVAAAELRAYAGGRAALDLALDRPVALVAELRRTLRHSLSVVEAREGRLAIEVGTVSGREPRPRSS